MPTSPCTLSIFNLSPCSVLTLRVPPVSASQGTSPATRPGPDDASRAAQRRSAELLGLCARGRQRSPMALLERAGEGMASLCRKQYYEGFVLGAQQGFEGTEAALQGARRWGTQPGTGPLKALPFSAFLCRWLALRDWKGSQQVAKVRGSVVLCL